MMGLQLTISASLDDTPNTEHVPSCGDCISATKTPQKRSVSQRGGRPKAMNCEHQRKATPKTGAHHYERVIENQY